VNKRSLFWLADDPAWAARRIGYSDPSLADTVPEDPAELATTLSTARTLEPDVSLEGCWSGTVHDQAALDALEQEAEQARHEGIVNTEAVKFGVGIVGAIAGVALAVHGIALALPWLVSLLVGPQ
jgi:hypothetical protein